jgi:hypothetical protein
MVPPEGDEAPDSEPLYGTEEMGKRDGFRAKLLICIGGVWKNGAKSMRICFGVVCFSIDF